MTGYLWLLTILEIVLFCYLAAGLIIALIHLVFEWSLPGPRWEKIVFALITVAAWPAILGADPPSGPRGPWSPA